MSKFGKFSVYKPKNWHQSSSGNLIWAKNQFYKKLSKKQFNKPKFGDDPFYKPTFSALIVPHTLPK